ncbi:DMT family transporter [Lacticaseibacillus sharpeae]|uniref:DMT family permease n=2 Tax=Lacticaseibacillus sharpeae TaxID=1626 RepID=A0A0R1ZK56_9LACO|nr:DMT family transporter [Lacticaseibacillus sharpeae]KRM55342.1 DMT family permease [Lacticaseibacillus sharpeae JCM 1186 = DSM 20505]
MQQSKLRAAIQAGIGTCMWGVGGVCSNIIFNNTAATPQWLSGMRMFWSGLVMLLLALATKKDIWAIWRDRRAAVRLIAFGLFGVAAAQLTYLLAIFYGNAAVATILLALVPAMITIIVSVRQKSMPRPIDTIAIIAALLGVFFLVTNGNVHELGVPLLAIFWGVMGACTGVAYTMLPRPLLNHYEPIIVVGWGLMLGGIVGNILHPMWRIPRGLTPTLWLAVFFVIFGATFLAYILYVSSLRILAPAVASMIGNFEPMTATILSVLFLNLDFHPLQLAGIITVLLAVFAMSWQPKKKRRRIGERE